MSKSSSLLSCLLLGACGVPPLARSPAQPGERVGTYDGRAVAVAYANGPRFALWMRELQAAHRAAKERGDQEEMRVLERRAAAQQRRFREQTFEGADIDDILGLIPAETEVQNSYYFIGASTNSQKQGSCRGSAKSLSSACGE